MSDADPTDVEANPAAPDVDPPDTQPGAGEGEKTGEEQARVNREDDPPA
jgi:hypothetical protein